MSFEEDEKHDPELYDAIRADEHRGTKRKGVFDAKARRQTVERLRELRKIIASKDERKFLEFLRRYGITDETAEFRELREMWFSDVQRR